MRHPLHGDNAAPVEPVPAIPQMRAIVQDVYGGASGRTIVDKIDYLIDRPGLLIMLAR